MRLASLALALMITGACGGARTAPQAGSSDHLLPPGAERAYRALSSRFDRDAAMNVVAFMQQYWRLAGNPGYNAAIDHIRDGLRDAGMPVFRVEEYPNPSRGWDYSVGTLRIDGVPEAVLSKERDRVSLAINSFSTPPGGVRAKLVDVGAGQPADF
jgi:aminopeptidase YwaD